MLVVCAEKFSDKIGSGAHVADDLRRRRVGRRGRPGAPTASRRDVEVLQTYASGPCSEVNSIIWPNPEFDNNITVYGPEVALARRALPRADDGRAARAAPSRRATAAALLDAIDLVVPHQANKTMVTELASDAGLAAEQLYFNIESVGNMSAASIPLAIHDAVADGVIDRPMRVFAPGFGAGAVGGYAVLRDRPGGRRAARRGEEGERGARAEDGDGGASPDDVVAAFG